MASAASTPAHWQAPAAPAAPVVQAVGSNVPVGPTHTLEVKLYKPQPTTKLGLTLTSMGTEAPAVTAIAPDGVGQAMLKLGDVVLSVNGAAGAGHEQTTNM